MIIKKEEGKLRLLCKRNKQKKEKPNTSFIQTTDINYI